ncbi:MAG: hypothetical protein ACT7A5_33830 [Ferrovibrionaceae bacterium]
MITHEQIDLAHLRGAATRSRSDGVLHDRAADRRPARADLIAAALALDSLVRISPAQPREILDAAAGLELGATGRLNVAASGRARATALSWHDSSLRS